jgi:hypothetical protein
MAPALVQRYLYCDEVDQYGNCYYSSWDTWGRWVALACIIVFVLFVAVLFSCINARRRRRQGLPPRYGTGWTASKWGTRQQPYYSNQLYNRGAPAPPYSPPVQNQQYTGNTLNSNEGYYGQQSGVELQPPKNTYAGRGGDPVYEAPQGPPPNKGYGYDGIIR